MVVGDKPRHNSSAPWQHKETDRRGLGSFQYPYRDRTGKRSVASPPIGVQYLTVARAISSTRGVMPQVEARQTPGWRL
jgi:hypothetical protein